MRDIEIGRKKEREIKRGMELERKKERNQAMHACMLLWCIGSRNSHNVTHNIYDAKRPKIETYSRM